MLNDTTSGLGKSDFLDLWFGLCNSSEICHPLSHKMKPNLTEKRSVSHVDLQEYAGPHLLLLKSQTVTESADAKRQDKKQHLIKSERHALRLEAQQLIGTPIKFPAVYFFNQQHIRLPPEQSCITITST